jgi:hypothetical protein
MGVKATKSPLRTTYLYPLDTLVTLELFLLDTLRKKEGIIKGGCVSKGNTWGRKREHASKTTVISNQ